MGCLFAFTLGTSKPTKAIGHIRRILPCEDLTWSSAHPSLEVYSTERVVAQTEMPGLCVDDRPASAPVMSGTSTSGAWMFLVPVVVLGLGNGTVSEVTRHLRGHLETVLTEDYIRTARAKGARLWRHLYKDGFVMPLSSLVASKTPYMLGGAVIVEQVFNWPGMGRLAWQAALDRDYPVLLGITLVAALVIRIGHMLKEATQVAVNPQLAP